MATQNLTSADLRFLLGFNAYTQKLVFTDITPYAAKGATLDLVRGKITAWAPDGSVFHADTTPSINGHTPIWYKQMNLPLDVPAEDLIIQRGSYIFQFDVSTDSGSTYGFTVTKTAINEYIRPEVTFVKTADTGVSTLTSVNDTDYNQIDNSGATAVPTITYDHKIYFPINGAGSRVASAATSTSITCIAGPDIYTGMYDIAMTAALAYVLELWDGNNFITMDDTVTGIDHYRVRKESCLCFIFNCVVAFQAVYESSIGYDLSEEQRLRKLLDRINDYYRLYEMCLECGEDGTTYYNRIVEILKNEIPCDCTSNDNDPPVEIIPITGSGGSGGGTIIQGNKWTSGTASNGLPSTGMNAYDRHLFTTTAGSYTKGDVYKYVSGVWSFDVSIAGAAGAAGADGSDAPVNYELLYNNSAEESTGSADTEKTLDGYQLAAGCIDVFGSKHIIKAVLTLAKNARGKKIMINFGDANICWFWSDALIVQYFNDTVHITAEITYLSAGAQKAIVTVSDGTGSREYLYPSLAQDESKAIDITVIGQNDLINSSGDITINLLSIEQENAMALA